jgi:hypothetical protein
VAAVGCGDDNDPVTVRRDQLNDAAHSWDVEYTSGRYRDEPPLRFGADILAAAAEHDLIGCERPVHAA